MSKILIVYGSVTGNTENIAALLAKKLTDAGQAVTLKSASDVQAARLAQDYDVLLLGASCWGEEEIELEERFGTLLAHADQMGLQDKKVAGFASGDSSYTHFCGAVDVVEKKAKDLGAQVLTDGLRLEGDGSSDAEAIARFVGAVLAGL